MSNINLSAGSDAGGTPAAAPAAAPAVAPAAAPAPAAPATPPVTPPAVPPATPATPPAQVTPPAEGTPEGDAAAKTYTQAELDALIAARVKREKSNAPSAEELKQFKAWQESQKTEAEKQAALVQDLQNKANLATAELTKYQNMDAIRKQGIDEKWVGYALFECQNAMAAKEGLSFDEALLAFVKDSGDTYKSAPAVTPPATPPADDKATPPKRQATVATDAKNPPPGGEQPMTLNFLGVRPKPKTA